MVSKPTAATRSVDPLDLLWRYSASDLATVLLAGLLAATLALAAIVRQVPAELTDVQATYWLTTTAAAYGGLGPALSALGIFALSHSIWLKLLLALFAYHLLVRCASEGRHLCRMRRRSASLLPPADVPPATLFLRGPVEETSAQAARMLSSTGLQPALSVADPNHITVHGVRHGGAALGPLMAYLGTLLVLLGLFINGVAGWSASNISLAAASATKVDAAPGLQLELETISGPENNPVSTIVLQDPNRGSARLGVTPQRPAAWRGLWLAERATGPALGVTGHDAQGKPVVFELPGATHRVGEAAHVLFTSTQTEQVFAAQAHNVAFRVVSYPALPERGIPETVFLVEAYRGADSTPAVSQLVREPTSLTLDNMVFAFQPERHAIVSVAYVPGLWLLVPGAFLGLAGLILWLWWRRSEGWISLVGSGTGVRASVRAAAVLEADADRARLASGLQDVNA